MKTAVSDKHRGKQVAWCSWGYSHPAFLSDIKLCEAYLKYGKMKRIMIIMNNWINQKLREITKPPLYLFSLPGQENSHKLLCAHVGAASLPPPTFYSSSSTSQLYFVPSSYTSHSQVFAHSTTQEASWASPIPCPSPKTWMLAISNLHLWVILWRIRLQCFRFTKL